jgi:4-cresol dehydrogenase (hydroxylating)
MVLAILRDVVGVEHVLTDTDVAGHRDPFSFTPGAFEPAAVVLPANVQEVQEVLRQASAHAVPVWTVSTGKNYGYGGAAPQAPGSIVMDLHRMDQVLEVNEECGYALLEPGVTFMALDKHLRQHAPALMASVPDIGWGSVMGNALERGFGYTPYGDHSAFVCGMEVVLADGSLVRTGMGAMEGNTAWQLYKGGYGPSLDGLFF